jgi:cellulose synthase/poly-beta-1,6-N-acetylglucosamine synthase-like glycosyltransferase
MSHGEEDVPPVVSLVIPTYRRPEALARALSGVAAQDRPPDEVLVVRRRDDAPSADVVRSASVAEVVVDEPGVLAAMIAGMRASTGSAVGFLDDDATPHPDWLARLLGHLRAPGVGVVGGRDVIAAPAQRTARVPDVGVVTRWGKLVGNHHLASGAPRDVAVLKGVNVLFRREALALPRSLRGDGAQVHWEVAACLWAAERGWRLVFDPEALVDHEPARRFDADRRDRPAPEAVENAAFNLVTTLVGGQPGLRRRRAAYGLLLGDRAVPGCGRAVLAVARRDRATVARIWPSLRGQLAALRARPPEMVTPDPR